MFPASFNFPSVVIKTSPLWYPSFSPTNLPLKQKADKVKEASVEFYSYLEDLKSKILDYISYYNQHLANMFNWSIISNEDIKIMIDKIKNNRFFIFKN